MPSKTDKSPKSDLHKWRNPLIIAFVLVAVGLVFLLKDKPSTTPTPDPTDPVSTHTTESTSTATSVYSSDGTPEEQVDRYMEQGQAAFIFFHSNNCQSCIDMMGVVDEVYPEFQEVLPIVDVNVYDPLNQRLLQRAQINTIPTQLFLGADGQGKISIGLMSPDQLREQLSTLVGAAQ